MPPTPNHGFGRAIVHATTLTAVCLLASCASTPAATTNTNCGLCGVTPPALQHILFVGDSFTHGRYTPVRLYNNGGTQNATTGSNLVVDENYGATGARAETLETGPFGGIPGIFAQFAVEASLNYDVHIEAISETSLQNNYAAASSIIDQSKWTAVILQEISTRPLTVALTGDSTSDPANFCASVATIEAGVHAVAATASIYLYETWPRADLAQTLAGSTSSPSFAATYATELTTLGDFYHNVYYSAATHDGHIAAVAPAGEAWMAAWAANVANSNPYTVTSSLPSLWYGLNASNNPTITAPDYLHPSIYGAYTSALVLFQQITGKDVRTLGASETAAASLGISSTIATQLQQIAWQTVTNESSTPINQTVDPCTLTH